MKSVAVLKCDLFYGDLVASCELVVIVGMIINPCGRRAGVMDPVRKRRGMRYGWS